MSVKREYLALQNYLLSLAPLSESDLAQFKNQLVLKRYSKKSSLFAAHNDGETIMFLNRGVARCYVLAIDGRDYTCSFHYQESQGGVAEVFVTDYASVMSGISSTLCFEALTDLEVVCIPVALVRELYLSNLRWGCIGRVIAEQLFFCAQQRSLSLLTLSATERYQQLLADLPISIADIPQLYIASYLGITPPSLSRIKKSLGLTQ